MEWDLGDVKALFHAHPWWGETDETQVADCSRPTIQRNSRLPALSGCQTFCRPPWSLRSAFHIVSCLQDHKKGSRRRHAILRVVRCQFEQGEAPIFNIMESGGGGWLNMKGNRKATFKAASVEECCEWAIALREAIAGAASRHGQRKNVGGLFR